jgi:hypothetical protein
VNRSPLRCASWMAAPSASRLMSVYALNQVAPSSAQYPTTRRAASASATWAMLTGPPGPVM